MTKVLDIEGHKPVAAATRRSHPDVQYPPSEIPMSLRDWILAGVIIVAVLTLVPMNWRLLEPLTVSGDYRIPYELSNDYWRFDQFSWQEAQRGKVLVIGDSVVWGHYVTADGALSAQLNRQCGSWRFANLGVDGIHPAAMAGLIEYYGSSISGRDVVLHCNLLWISSPRHDLQERKEFAFNHQRLVPQLFPWIDCYGESFSGRLAVTIGRELPSSRLAQHLRVAYFAGADVPTWTLEHPYDNPLAAITLCPSGNNPSHLPPGATEETWTQRQTVGLTPDWVDLPTSFQWSSFERTIALLRHHGNRVFVVVGPFNEHMLKGPALATYRQRVEQVEAWLTREGIAHRIAPVLPSEEYADASHPLRAGYVRMAQQLMQDAPFAAFVSRSDTHKTGSLK